MLVTFLFGPVSELLLIVSVVFFLPLLKESDSSESRAELFLSEPEASSRIPPADSWAGVSYMSAIGHPFYFRDAFKATVAVVFSSFHTCAGPWQPPAF